MPTPARLPAVATLTALALLAIGAPAGAQAPSQASGDIYGVWKNPKGTVHLEIRPCENQTCGYVVWASEAARADARKGSGDELVGRQLLRDFQRADNGDWRGKVFVPDLNMTFSGRVTVLDPAKLRAKGCVLGNLLCKSQVWTRVG